MLRILTTLTLATLISLGLAAPASAGGYGDGKPAGKNAQKAACAETKKITALVCKEAAKLPDYWVHIDGVNYHRSNGASAVKAVRDAGTPDEQLAYEFVRLVREFEDAHASI